MAVQSLRTFKRDRGGGKQRGYRHLRGDGDDNMIMSPRHEVPTMYWQAIVAAQFGHPSTRRGCCIV